MFQAARCPRQRRGSRRFSQQNKFQSLRRSSWSEKNKNKIFEYRRLSLYHVSGKEIFDLYGNGNASLQFRCYPSAGVFITWTSLPYLIMICKSSNENKIFYHRWKLGTKTVERSGNRWISLFLDGFDQSHQFLPPLPLGVLWKPIYFLPFCIVFLLLFVKKKVVWKQVDFRKKFHKKYLFLIDGSPCQALKIYDMGFLCWCNVKVKKILQEEATKRKQAELNHNFWKSVVFKIFAAKSSWKNNIRDDGSTALYNAHTVYTV